MPIGDTWKDIRFREVEPNSHSQFGCTTPIHKSSKMVSLKLAFIHLSRILSSRLLITLTSMHTYHALPDFCPYFSGWHWGFDEVLWSFKDDLVRGCLQNSNFAFSVDF